jgi:hypothetical protein
VPLLNKASGIEENDGLQNSQWTNLATLVSDGIGAFSYNDKNITGQDQRFYRAALPQEN